MARAVRADALIPQTPDLHNVIVTLLPGASATPPRQVPSTDDVAAEYTERVVHQLEHQARLNVDLTARGAAGGTAGAPARARSSAHTLVVEAPPPIQACVDPLRLEQVLTYLIDNAIKYSPDGGLIAITISTPPPDLVRHLCRTLREPPRRCLGRGRYR